MKNLSEIVDDKDIVTKEYLEANAGGDDRIDGGSASSVYTLQQIIDGGDVSGN